LDSREYLLDPWGNEYAYRYPGKLWDIYDLWSRDPHGLDNTDEDIGNWQFNPCACCGISAGGAP
jgi:hypothetical protein